MKQKLFTAVLALVLLLAFTACSNNVNSDSNTTEAFALEEYRSSINESSKAIYDSAVDLDNISNYIKIHGESREQLGLSGDPVNSVKNAFAWYEEKTNTTREMIDTDYKTIRQQYKSIILTPPVGTEAEMMHKYYTAIYDAYADLYLLTTAPTCTRSVFVERYNALIDSIVGAYEDLSLFIE